MNTAFLLHVKDTVARKQMQSKEALRLRNSSHPHLKCEQAASEDLLLSHDNCVSFNTPYPTCKNGFKGDCLSERSDRSTVAGKVNFKRPRCALRVKSSNERIPADSREVLSGYPSTAWNAFICGEKKKRRRVTMMHRHYLHTQDQLTCDSRLLPRQRTVSSLGQTGQHFDGKSAVNMNSFLKDQHSTQRPTKSVTVLSHQQDQKKLIKQYQRWLREMLKELQKQCNMGLIVPSRFEKKKKRVLKFLQSIGGGALSILPLPSSSISNDFFSTKSRSFQVPLSGFSTDTLQTKKKMFSNMDSSQCFQNPTLPLTTNRNFCKTIDITQ